MKNDVLKYFREISDIPRGSGNEKGISDYLVAFAIKHGFDYVQDESLNVIIRKKASPGYEQRPSVVLQGHMDMVCEKNADTDHDFSKDPIRLRTVGDMIYGTGTTLGADNGIGVALGLALLASGETSHPSLELLLTTDEERGMKGAASIDPEKIEGRILINIDSDREGKFIVSCAGGPTVKTAIPIKWEIADAGLEPFAVKISGLLGGHSGEDIDKGRANAIKLMGRILKNLEGHFAFRLASLSGGMMYNAIPRESEAVVMIRPQDKEGVAERLEELESVLRNEFRSSEPCIQVIFEEWQGEASEVFSKETMESAINYLYLVENGIHTMNGDIEGLVESSVSLGVVRTGENEIELKALIRSSVKSIYQEMLIRLEAFAGLFGGEASALGNCPRWQYNPHSWIRELCEETFFKMYGRKAEISAMHAGLECGIFDEIFDGKMDMISLGPDTYEFHTPQEHLSISSAERTWEFLQEVLKGIR